jgi:hypothetical protein
MALSLRQTRQKDPAEWFLISGDFCIRLIRPVTIGVDANGVLQLNAKEVTGRWLTLEVAPDVNSAMPNLNRQKNPNGAHRANYRGNT